MTARTTAGRAAAGRRRALVTTAIAATALVLAACGNGKPGSDDAIDPAAAAAPTTAAASATEVTPTPAATTSAAPTTTKAAESVEADAEQVISLKPLPAAGGTIYRVKVKPQGKEEFGSGEVALWLPKGAKQIRGLHIGGASGESSAGDPTPSKGGNREAAALKFHLAVVTHAYTHRSGTPDRHELYCDRGSGAGLVRGLNAIAKQSGHPEIAKAPFVLTGYSLAGHCSKGIAVIMPQRVAVMTVGGIGVVDCTKPKVATIPALMYGGAADGFMSTALADLKKCRARGMPIAVALKPGAGHAIPSDKALVTPWWMDMLARRLPQKVGDPLRPVTLSAGLLGDNKSLSVTKYSSSDKSKSWLPSSAAAKEWKKWSGG